MSISQRLGLMAGAYLSMRSVYIAYMDEDFSRTIKAGQIRQAPQDYSLAADDTARAALAARFGIPGIARLEGRFALRHERSGILAAHLVMIAEVTLLCAVTLEPFSEALAEEVDLRFVPAREDEEKDGEEEDLTPESLDGPDEIPFTGDMIDLGAALAEQLALALPPYPRKPGAELPAAARDDSANPFAILARKPRGEA